jgi:hypothetical protein
MNNQQNFYQQQFSQPPQPRKPKSNVKWFVLGGVALLLVSFLVYGAVQLGKKFGNGIGNFANTVAGSADSLDETIKNEAYSKLLTDINADTGITDSTRMVMTAKIIAEKRRAAAARLMVRNYGNGFIDTMQGKSGLTALNKMWAHHFFIETGRAAAIKNALLVLRDSSYDELPDSQKDVHLLEKIPLFEPDSTMPAYLAKLTRWETLTFDQPVISVNVNIQNLLEEIRNYENGFIDIYRNYFEMQHKAAAVYH